MNTLKPIVKWSGSKRSQAQKIVSTFPKKINIYFEPFLGGGAILGHLKPEKAVAGDINKPLIKLWKLVRDKPEHVIKTYSKHWANLEKIGHTYFYKIRKKFNKTQSPVDLLFLTRTCVNGLIRYNSKGKFNNSLHYTRKGIMPSVFAKTVREWSIFIQGYNFYSKDYRETTKKAARGDFVYLDPPYFNTRGRYFGGIKFEEFLKYLEELNDRGVKFALSYDGSRGDKNYQVTLPKDIYKRHLLLLSGNSTFNKVQNKKTEKVYESLYLNY